MESGSSQCPRCGAVRADLDPCRRCGPVDESAGDISGARRDHAPTPVVEDAFASPEARTLAEQLAALVSGQSAAGTSSNPETPATLTKSAPLEAAVRGLPPRPRRATSPMVGAARRRSVQAARRRQRRGLLAGTAVLGVTLAGLALAQVIAHVQGGSGDREETGSGSLVSAGGPGDRTRVECWDGSSAFGVIECGEPAGLTGLVWVFPSIERDSCEPGGRAGGQQTWSCLVNTRSGAQAEVVYRELFSVERAFAFYSGKYGLGLAERKQRAGRYLWRAGEADERGLWQISSMYVDHPWAAHVEADTKKGARQGFETIEFRPVEDLRGVQPPG